MTDKDPQARQALKRKLHIRSWRRGTREMDLLLGRWADENLKAMGEDELAVFARLLKWPDTMLMPLLVTKGDIDPIEKIEETREFKEMLRAIKRFSGQFSGQFSGT